VDCSASPRGQPGAIRSWSPTSSTGSDTLPFRSPAAHARRYTPIGSGPEQNDLVAVDILTEIVIGAAPEHVAAYAGDPSKAPDWYANISAVEWLTPPPAAVGSRMSFVAHFLGRRLAYTYEIAELVPGERLVMRTAEGPFPMETTYTWEPSGDGGTRMTLRNRGEPAGFAKITAPMMSRAMRRANEKDLAALKRLLER
jgi:uncharacterized protein YndB with AHSA1/START domain